MAGQAPVNLCGMTSHSAPILLLVDRSDMGLHSLGKAMLLARYLRAPLELHLCEVSPWVGSRDSPARTSQVSQLQGAAQTYLRALLQKLSLGDLHVRCESQVASSWADGLTQRLRRAAVLLVVAPLGAQALPDPRAALHWSLLHACTVPLLLPRQRIWKPVPKFGAAIDLGSAADEEQAARLIGLAERWARGCHALLEYLYVAGGQAEGKPAQQAWHRLGALAGAAPDGAGLKGWLHYHPAEAEAELPRAVAARDYDLMMMGRPRRRSTLPGFIDDDEPCLAPSRARSQAAPTQNTWTRLLRGAAGDLLLLPAASSTE